ncbi:hypothetical protein Btru_064598 [Bulinus truncatus]|nr:hypothetical protein Btru_064598 [Bulinus truncatus]
MLVTSSLPCAVHQVSLLMVTAEQKDNSGKKPLRHIGENGELQPDLVNCASKIMAEAVQKFITESEKHSKNSQSQEFIKKVSTANENLTVTIDQLLIVAHRFESVNSTDNIKQTLCQAARDVLQGVIKVLLVVDDFYVQGLLNKVDAVVTTLKSINTAEDYSQTKKKLAHLAVSVMGLRASLFKRTRNLISKTCSDQLTIWGNVLQSSMRVLHQVTKTCSQYPSNVSAKASYDSVEQEIIQACQKIKQLLTSGPEDSVDDEIINFVVVVDQLIDMLTEAQQGSLHEDAESHIVTLVQHSMSVAHCSAGVYREMIMTSCQRILQLKFRLTELNDIIKTKPSVQYMRSDFVKLCETALDEICDLEKHVTMALLHMIIEIFLSPNEKITKLRKVAIIQNSSAQFSDLHKNQVKEFIDYTENVCQVALLVASSSTDGAKVREIVTAVNNLESFEVEISPAVTMNCRDPKNRVSNKHLELILGRWSQEVKTIIDAIDKLVDPRVFMEMTESMLCKEVDKFKSMEGSPYNELLNHNYRVRNLATRPKVIAEKLVDESADPIYRNGLRCFIKTLTEISSLLDEKSHTPHRRATPSIVQSHTPHGWATPGIVQSHTPHGWATPGIVQSHTPHGWATPGIVQSHTPHGWATPGIVQSHTPHGWATPGIVQSHTPHRWATPGIVQSHTPHRWATPGIVQSHTPHGWATPGIVQSHTPHGWATPGIVQSHTPHGWATPGIVQSQTPHRWATPGIVTNIHLIGGPPLICQSNTPHRWATPGIVQSHTPHRWATPDIVTNIHLIGLSDADAVYKELLQTKHPSSLQYDTVDRRLKIVLQALRNLREGLDVNKHPHIMSKERLLFSSRGELEGLIMFSFFYSELTTLELVITSDTFQSH